MNIIQHTTDVLKYVAARSKKVILFYSGGKDSIVLLDLAAHHFEEVHIVYMYFVKGMEHIERYLRWASAFKYPNVIVHQVPHWNLTYILRSGMYCVAQPNVKLMKLADVDEAMKIKTGINWSMYGMKMSDGMDRRLMLKTYEMNAISTTNKAYPLALWKKDEVLRYIKNHNLPEPISYGTGKKSSGLSFDAEVFAWLRTHYPADLEKILTQFPLSGRLLFDYDRKQSKL